MKTRRDFIKLFGGMFAAGATLFAGKGLADNLNAPEERVPDGFALGGVVPKDDTTRVMLDPGESKENAHGILRIAQASSQWVAEDKVQRGHWFVHNYGSTECIDLGPEIVANRIDYVGMKAMSFDLGELGTLPTGVTTDPESPEFKDIVKRAAMPYPAPIGQLWGPVYTITGRHPFSGREIHAEFFCHSKTLRRFAMKHLARGLKPKDDCCTVLENVSLISRQVSNSKFSYYLPELRSWWGVQIC